MRGVALGALVLVAVASLGSGIAAGEPPLADAGLDRTVDVGHPVRLDATGSRAPNGTIKAYEWHIEAPNGTAIEPTCPDCGTTAFSPLRRGRYRVTVTVTDDRNVSRSDTGYVTAEAGQGPSVSVSGPQRPTVGQSATYTATATSGDVPLRGVRWAVNGSTVERSDADGARAEGEFSRQFNGTANRTVAVTAVDVAGQQANETVEVAPHPPARGGGGGGGDSDEYMRVDWADNTYYILTPQASLDGGDPVSRSRVTGRRLEAIATDTTGNVDTMIGDDPSERVNTGETDNNGIGV